MNNLYTFNEYTFLGEDFLNELHEDSLNFEAEIDSILETLTEDDLENLHEALDFEDDLLEYNFEEATLEELDELLIELNENTKTKAAVKSIKKLKDALKKSLKRIAAKFERKRRNLTGDSKALQNLKKFEKSETAAEKAKYWKRMSNSGYYTNNPLQKHRSKKLFKKITRNPNFKRSDF